MGINPDFRDLFSELSTVDARFLVVGAHAVMYHSVPRYTKDLDVWVAPDPENANRVFTALARFGAPLDQLSADDLCTPGTVYQIGVEPNRIDVLTRLGDLSFDGAWERRVTTTYGGIEISVLCIDDVIESKQAAGRPQDLLDVEWLQRAKRRGKQADSD